MTFAVDVRADMKRVLAKVDALDREKTAAAVRGLNRAAEGTRTDAVKDLKVLYPGLKVSSIRGRIKVQRASRTTLRSSARFSGSRISIYGNFGMRTFGRFGVRFGKLPWRVETLEGSLVDTAMLERTFRNRIEGGRAAALARLGPPRLPITMLVAPSLSKAVVEKKLQLAYKASGAKRFEKEFSQAVRAIVAKRMGNL